LWQGYQGFFRGRCASDVVLFFPPLFPWHLPLMQRDFRKQYYSNIGVLHDDPKFKAALAEKVVNVPLLKEMILRLGLPMSCRAVAWRLLLNVAHPTSETWPDIMSELKSRYENLQACATACQVWQRGMRTAGDKHLQAVNFALLQMLHTQLRHPQLGALPAAPIPSPSVGVVQGPISSPSPSRRHSGGSAASRAADRPPRCLETDTRTEVALKAGIARIFGEVFDEEGVAYFCFAGLVDFVQGDAPTWAVAVQGLVGDLYRIAADHCKEVWSTGPFHDLRLQQKDEIDLLLRDVIGSVFACHLERRHLLGIYDVLLCYAADFIPYVAAGFLKVGWLMGPLRQCKRVVDVRQALGSRDHLNNSEIQKHALSRAKEWYLSSPNYSKLSAHPVSRPPVSLPRKKAPTQPREPKQAEGDAAAVATFRRALTVAVTGHEPPRTITPDLRAPNTL